MLETTSTQVESCVINDVNTNAIAENVPPATREVVVESSDSECQFVLALKPPHLRTPEQVSLDSASDSDVVFVPPDPVCSSDSDTEDNKPLSVLQETKKLLKSEMVEETVPEISMGEHVNLLNYGASTSTASQPDESVTNQKKLYYHPIRKRLSGKSIFDSSSSDSSSSDSETSDEEWQSKMTTVHKRNAKSRRKSSKNFKKRRVSSSMTGNQKPLSELPSSGEAREEEEAENETSPMGEQFPLSLIHI